MIDRKLQKDSITCRNLIQLCMWQHGGEGKDGLNHHRDGECLVGRCHSKSAHRCELQKWNERARAAGVLDKPDDVARALVAKLLV